MTSVLDVWENKEAFLEDIWSKTFKSYVENQSLGEKEDSRKTKKKSTKEISNDYLNLKYSLL